MQILKRLLTEEEGQDVVEYALMVGLVCFVIWLAAKNSGVDTSVSSLYSSVKSSLAGS